MTEFSQESDIEIPVVEICAGWTVDDIENLDDCDDAFAYLTGALTHIEAVIDWYEESGIDKDDKYYRTKRARRWKKAALQIIQTKRGRFNREAKKAERRYLLEQFARAVSDADRSLFKTCMARATDAANDA